MINEVYREGASMRYEEDREREIMIEKEDGR